MGATPSKLTFIPDRTDLGLLLSDPTSKPSTYRMSRDVAQIK